MKKMTLVPIGGLANRVLAMTSAINYCRDKNLYLDVIWFKDSGLFASFHDVFILSPEVKNVSIVDASFYDYLFYDRPRKRNLWIPGLFQKILYARRVYEDELAKRTCYTPFLNSLEGHNKIYLVECSHFYKSQKWESYIYPKPEIQHIIDNRIKMFTNETFGIHIRRTDMIAAIENSPLDLFKKKIEGLLSVNSNAMFYIASDSLRDKIELKNIFGESIITILEETSRDSLGGIIEGIVDLYTLANTCRILGSYNSSYSYLASLLYNKPLEIITK